MHRRGISARDSTNAMNSLLENSTTPTKQFEFPETNGVTFMNSTIENVVDSDCHKLDIFSLFALSRRHIHLHWLLSTVWWANIAYPNDKLPEDFGSHALYPSKQFRFSQQLAIR